VARPRRQVIDLRLATPLEMFELPRTDLLSEYRNLLTGVEFCISELRSRRDRRPVRLDIELPPTEIDDRTEVRLAHSLSRYCDQRIRYNRREQHAIRFDGISALRIGIPLAVLGLVLTALAVRIVDENSPLRLLEDHIGWVFAWIGLWYPLDAFFFYPLAYTRENRVLALLAQAEVSLRPHDETATDSIVEAASTPTWRRARRRRS
jgi:hypothetical protein